MSECVTLKGGFCLMFSPGQLRALDALELRSVPPRERVVFLSYLFPKRAQMTVPQDRAGIRLADVLSLCCCSLCSGLTLEARVTGVLAPRYHVMA
jgi:hypothetical protein